MKKIPLLTICFAIAIFGGCENIFSGKPDSQYPLPDGYGALHVSFAQNTARTGMPSNPIDPYLEFTFTRKGDSEDEWPSWEKNGNTYTFILRAGEYTMVVKAWPDSSHTTEADLVAEVTVDITIKTGNNNVSVALHPKSNGDGTLQFTFNYSTSESTFPSFYVDTFTLTPVFGDEPPVNYDNILGLLPGNELVMGNPYTVQVPAGYYLLSMTLRKRDLINSDSFANILEVVHIYQGMPTERNYEFTSNNFIESLFVTNTLDPHDTDNNQIQGSLRYAIGKASNFNIRTIKVMLPPGSEIKLNNYLEVYAKVDLVIEGNGIILSKSAEPWTGDVERPISVSSYSQPVTIRRVHFKDSDIGAIKNSGKLTLESCIFSGNIADYAGGAIVNDSTGDLYLKGCTFYNNHADYSGGAIYNDGYSSPGGKIELTGNLFFGNTAPNWPVIHNEGGNVTSKGYNVVDVDFGDASAECGWAKASGDILVDELSFSPKTFRLFSNSDAATPFALPAQYPSKDFYGEPIEAPVFAGAVQNPITRGFYLDLDKGHGNVTVSPASADFTYGSGTPVTLTANPLAGSVFEGWLVNGAIRDNNPLTLTMNSNTSVKAKFSLPPVTSIRDESGSINNMTLRYALSIARDGDVIKFRNGLVTPGESVITLVRPLPVITKSITIEGSGITLTPGYSDQVSILNVSEDADEVTISRVHFKDGNGYYVGGAIHNHGNLTLESCIFNGNITNDSGGAIYNTGDLYLKGCTFYKNEALYQAGAIYNGGGSIELTGNLFYGNSAPIYPVICPDQDIKSNGYNVVDVNFGTGNNQSGWNNTSGNDIIIDAAKIPFSLKTFRLFSDSTEAFCITTRPTGYPEQDFYGEPITFPAAAGAVQGKISSGYFLDLEYYPDRGSLTFSNAPDKDGFVSGPTTLTATTKPGYSFSHWVWGDAPPNTDVTLTVQVDGITRYTKVKAVFDPLISDLRDGPNSKTTRGTLRYALANAKDNDIIRFNSDTAGKEIKLNSPLEINYSITIEGAGLILSQSDTWTATGFYTPLLNIEAYDKDVTIQRVHFKNGSSYCGGAINSNRVNLTIESCIFSNNTAIRTGSAIYNEGAASNYLTVKGCTFYNNYAEGNFDGGGGAICSIASANKIILTGNLFYNNTGGTKPVLNAFIPTSSSFSYNAIDVSLETSGLPTTPTGAGTQFSGALIDTSTFKPILSGLMNFIPLSAQADFPTVDFNGNPRKWPGAPGAVNGD
jgi:hypothetical protein